MNINRKISLINFNNSNRPASQIKFLVIHYVGAVSSAENNANYFYSTYRGASAHYFVDENSIWQCVEENDTAWHCGTTGRYYNDCRNSNSIGIEMCCKNNGNWYFEEATVNNTVALAQEICKRYGIDRNHVVRHYDVTRKNCPEPYVRDSAAWNSFLDRVFGASQPSQPSTPAAPVENPTGSYTVTITTAVLNVRANHTTNSAINTQVKKGEVYTIVETNGDWGRLKSGAGWINLNYTSKNGASSANTGSTNISKRMQVKANGGLNVRNTPGGNKVGALTNGTIVTVTAESNGWSKIGEGKWVSSQYLVAVNNSVNVSINVGDQVRIKSSAANYVTGQKIPSWVKNNSYKVIQKTNGKCLLDSIMSWVYEKDLTK